MGLVNETYTIRGGMPPSVKQYPLLKEALPEIRQTVQQLVQLGVLAKIDSPPCSLPIQAVRKPDGTWRMVNDLRALNRRAIKDKRTLPLDEASSIKT